MNDDYDNCPVCDAGLFDCDVCFTDEGLDAFRAWQASEAARVVPVALYVASDSIYNDLGLECFDEERDATTYDGDAPIIAHPPCRHWGKLAWAAKGDDKHLAWIALDQVRTNGGVLEHPVGSRFFKEAGIPVPKEFGVFGDWDEFGGCVIKLRQYDLGHRGYKGTYFYIFGTMALPPLWQRMDEDDVKPVQNMAQKERLATPAGVAWWLRQVAAACTPAQTFRDLLRQHGNPERNAA